MSKLKEINQKLIPEANIGLVGHVAHGKTTLTKTLTGKLTLSHSEELKRGITIRLGYADTTIYKDKDNKYTLDEKLGVQIERTISFVDAPGHETLMATVLSGASIMDGAILIISAVEKCPQPQTREHLAALEVVGIKNVVVVQNKIDLVSPKRAMESYKEIKNFLKGSNLENAPIIPISAQYGINIEVVLSAIQEIIPTPKRDLNKNPKMLVARSFDINKPGTDVEKIAGGVVGGTIIDGKLKVGEEIEIRPGIKIGNNYKIINTKIIGLKKAGKNLTEAGPGGLVGLMTEFDPYITKSDSLVGCIIGKPNKLPEIRNSLSLKVQTIKRIVQSEDFKNVKPMFVGENLLLNVGSARTVGEIKKLKQNNIETNLKIPISADKNERVVISRLINGNWKLIGYGIIQ